MGYWVSFIVTHLLFVFISLVLCFILVYGIKKGDIYCHLFILDLKKYIYVCSYCSYTHTISFSTSSSFGKWNCANSSSVSANHLPCV